MAGAVQELANGRLVLGIGAGNQAQEHRPFGLDFEHRVGRSQDDLDQGSAVGMTFAGRRMC